VKGRSILWCSKTSPVSSPWKSVTVTRKAPPPLPADAAPCSSGIVERLYNYGEPRIKEMDEAGIDVQALSHAPPAAQQLAPQAATELATRANDRLQEIVLSLPDWFAAFATLPTPDPIASAGELERCVVKCGFKGAMVHGLTNGVFLMTGASGPSSSGHRP
jgi:predicted TIM-barrel fold metal-dependent hydrolase